MTLGERIKACRQRAGMSQEKVAELVGVSRQAVTKWEVNQSAPNTENLFKLAEIFGTTVDLLLASENESPQASAEQLVRLIQREEQKTAAKKQKCKENCLTALFVAVGYLAMYLIGRVVWCNMSQSSLVGWLFSAIPSGKHSYLYGWLLSSHLFWYAAVISVIPALFGKRKLSCATLAGFVVGLGVGMIFGPNPQGAAMGQSHYGWAIWGMSYLASAVVGILAEIYGKRRSKTVAV